MWPHWVRATPEWYPGTLATKVACTRHKGKYEGRYEGKHEWLVTLAR